MRISVKMLHSKEDTFKTLNDKFWIFSDTAKNRNVRNPQ